MTSILASALLYTLLPLAVALLLVLLISARRTTPHPFRIFLRSLTNFPLFDILARLWPLQTFLPLLLLSLTTLFILTLTLSTTIYLSSIAFANTIEFISALFRALDLAPFFALLRPFDDFNVPPHVSSSFTTFFATISQTVATLNTTQLSDCITPSSPFALPTPSKLPKYAWADILALIHDVAICPPILSALPDITLVTSDLLASIDLPTFFNSTTLPQKFHPALEQLSTASQGVAAHLNLTQLLVDQTINPDLQAALHRIQPALSHLLVNANFTHILATATRRPAAKESIATIQQISKDPSKAIPIILPSDQVTLSTSSFREFLRTIPIPIYVFLFFIVLAILCLPLLFFVRAAVMEALKKVFTTRYYERSTPEQDRSVSGWLRAATSVALGVGLADSLPACLLTGILVGAGVKRATGLAIHALSLIPLHVATQIRVGESMARTDVLKDGAADASMVLVFTSMFHGVAAMGWNAGAVAVVASRSVWVALFIDGFPALVALVYGWRVWKRALQREQRVEEERQRKDD